jgi:predicted nucleotidyltransferase
MTTDSLLAHICEELISRYRAHTILLYGSRANGTAGDDSDYDIAAFAPTNRMLRDARLFKDKYLDAFVYPETVLAEPSADHLHIRGSTILLQKERLAETFLRRLDEVFDAGPAALPPDELATKRAWPQKMRKRIARGDIEGNYRRVWLLTTLLEDYFHLRGLWYLGPKKSFQWLDAHDPTIYHAFSHALELGATDRDIHELVQLVVGK